MRKIIHVDMDAFFASVEQRDHPELRGKPVAVGGSSDRGVVAAASYEARKFGVHSAMPSKIAFQKCPNIIFVKHRFDVYKEVSRQIRAIFSEYTDLIEPLSLDEAYLDVTHNKIGMPSATLIARDIKKKIKEQTNLTASAGVSMNKFLAKIASDMDKPDGLTVILPENAQQLVDELPVKKFHGIGKVTAAKMNKLGIFTGNDLKNQNQEWLTARFGKSGKYYFNISHAIDDRPVNPNRIRKSISTEDTFEKDLTELAAMRKEAHILAHKVMKWMVKNQTFGKTLTLKVKFSDFKQITRSKTILENIDNIELLLKLADGLLESFDSTDVRVRLLGLGISNLNNQQKPTNPQLTLDF